MLAPCPRPALRVTDRMVPARRFTRKRTVAVFGLDPTRFLIMHRLRYKWQVRHRVESVLGIRSSLGAALSCGS